MHELLHTLGFGHEHNRYDRDDYVKIYFNRIVSNKHSNFKKFAKNQTLETTFGLPYDLLSILHYRTVAYPKI